MRKIGMIWKVSFGDRGWLDVVSEDLNRMMQSLLHNLELATCRSRRNLVHVRPPKLLPFSTRPRRCRLPGDVTRPRSQRQTVVIPWVP